MICDHLSNWRAHAGGLPQRYATAFAWIEKNATSLPPLGRNDLADGCYAIVQQYEPRTLAGTQFEAHRKFADLQYVVAGRERIYWVKPRAAKLLEPYSDAKDIEFYEAKDPSTTATGLLLEAGMFAIFAPSDWHIPCIAVDQSPAPVQKIVVKIPV